MDAGPSALTRHLKHYPHLFVKDGQEGEPIATFYISKTMDLALASDLIPIPYRFTFRKIETNYDNSL